MGGQKAEENQSKGSSHDFLIFGEFLDFGGSFLDLYIIVRASVSHVCSFIFF